MPNTEEQSNHSPYRTTQQVSDIVLGYGIIAIFAFCLGLGIGWLIWH
jgi:hypothetical protein